MSLNMTNLFYIITSIYLKINPSRGVYLANDLVVLVRDLDYFLFGSFRVHRWHHRRLLDVLVRYLPRDEMLAQVFVESVSDFLHLYRAAVQQHLQN